MLQSQLFTKTSKTTPKDEVSISSQLLIKAGYIDKLMSGVYTYLPLGYLVLKNIEKIIREEIQLINAQEILMPSLTPKDPWVKTGRWKTFTDLYKLTDANKKDVALAATHEEVITPLAKKFIDSYRDLPTYIFQIQNKFRSELRAKSGLIRGREFIMKDLYSFHQDANDLEKYYQKVIKAYNKIFTRCEIDKNTFFTFASGGTFSKYSHEFQTTSEAGEDSIHICTNCKTAINKEIKTEQKNCPVCNKNKFELKKSIEVGNIFKLGEKYSRAFKFEYIDKNGKAKPIIMGCYGIGLGRLLSTIVELNNDQGGIIWPKETTPFQTHLINIDNEKTAKELYKKLEQEGISILYDDRNLSAGIKLNDSDLMGIPIRIISSQRNKDKFELKIRNKKETTEYGLNQIINKVKNYYA